MKASVLLALAFAAMLQSCVTMPALARRTVQYANAPQAQRDWYGDARLTPRAQRRLGFVGCCDEGEVVRTQFKVSAGGKHGREEWYWLDSKSNRWRRVPDDIIHWGKSSYDGRATLFVLEKAYNGAPAGTPTCFWPPVSGN